jgi:hypothetical protein
MGGQRLLLTFGGFLLLGGRIADLVGRRLIFIVGRQLVAAIVEINPFTRTQKPNVGALLRVPRSRRGILRLGGTQLFRSLGAWMRYLDVAYATKPADCDAYIWPRCRPSCANPAGWPNSWRRSASDLLRPDAPSPLTAREPVFPCRLCPGALAWRHACRPSMENLDPPRARPAVDGAGDRRPRRERWVG